MPTIERRPRRVRAARVLLALAAAALVWAIVLTTVGGVDFQIYGQRIRSHEPLRAFAVAAIALAIWVPLHGTARAHDAFRRATRRLDDGPMAIGLALFIFVVGLAYSSTAATGSDSYGYVSQADLWRAGNLRLPQPWVARVPWPTKAWSFTPLGYRPLDPAHEDILVPTYSPGLPLMMAAIASVFGRGASFAVVPAAAAALVYLTYGIGRRIGLRRAGLIGAWFTATSPVVLYMMMVPMTDVPVAAAWAAAMFFALGGGWPNAAAAGLAAALAILIRPNLAPLAAILGLLYVRRGGRGRALAHGAIYALGTSLGLAATLAINATLYGSPFVSGYGDVSSYFGWRNVLPNLRLYSGWLLDVQTPLVLAGVAALLVPLRRLWPEVRPRAFFAVAALFITAIWAQYCAYLQFEFWTYLRFLLPTWPLMTIGMGAVAVWLARAAPPGRTLAVMGVVLCLGVYEYDSAASRGAFEVWKSERASVVIAHRVREVTAPGSVVLSMSHSGSVRYYAGRMTLRYDLLDRDWLDRGVAWLAAQGAHPYLLLDDWELPAFLDRFAGQRAPALVERRPIFTYQGAGRTFLFDLLAERDASGAVVTLADATSPLRAAPPAPPPRFLSH